MPFSSTDPRALRETLAPYQRPSLKRGIFEIVVTLSPLAILWGAALHFVGRGDWAGLLLAPLASVFLVRMFMIQHDCGHASFFASKTANTWTGRLIGVLTVTPYEYWRHTHAIHHATSGDLDRRGLGGVEILTAEEYAAASPLRRLGYRLYRHPFVMFVPGAAYMFILQHRLPIGLMRERWAWLSVMGGNLGLAILLAAEILLVGVTPALAVHGVIVAVAASIGVWLFYVQHQFDEAYWARRGEWKAQAAALQGSSHLDLPPPLNWLTAYIGVHHVHHLSSRIPFYRLPKVLRDHAQFRTIGRVTLGESFRMTRLGLWNETHRRLTPF